MRGRRGDRKRERGRKRNCVREREIEEEKNERVKAKSLKSISMECSKKEQKN